jgi:hypothetical protein
MRSFLVLGCALLLNSCDNGGGPGPVTSGRYRLILIDDQPLPKLVNAFGLAGTQHRVAEGDLFFDGSAAIQRTHYDQKATASDPVPTFSDSAHSAFTLKGPTLVVTHVYGLTLVPDTGYVEGSLLIVRQNLKTNLGQRTTAKFTLKYQRQ